MTTDTVIELQDVMKNYRGRLALDGCSLSIPRGRVAAVVGSNFHDILRVIVRNILVGKTQEIRRIFVFSRRCIPVVERIAFQDTAAAVRWILYQCTPAA